MEFVEVISRSQFKLYQISTPRINDETTDQSQPHCDSRNLTAL